MSVGGGLRTPWLRRLQRNGALLLFRARAPISVDLGPDEEVLKRDGDALVARLTESDEDWVAADGSRLVMLRAYQWNPRHRVWTLVGRLNGMWFAAERRFGIADLEIFTRYRSRGHGSRLLRSCLDIARGLGADVVTGNLSSVDDVERLRAWYPRFGFAVEPPQQIGMVASIIWTPTSKLGHT